MRYLLYDELLPTEIEAVKAYIAARGVASGLDGLYWLYMPEERLSEAQRGHQAVHGPYRVGVELGPDWFKIELLVRAAGLENVGAGWADEGQTAFIINWSAEMARELNLKSS